LVDREAKFAGWPLVMFWQIVAWLGLWSLVIGHFFINGIPSHGRVSTLRRKAPAPGQGGWDKLNDPCQ
jgi:hypothetical protein